MFFACLREKLFHAWGGEASTELGSEAVMGNGLWEQGPQAGHCGDATGKVEVCESCKHSWQSWHSGRCGGLGDLN